MAVLVGVGCRVEECGVAVVPDTLLVPFAGCL